MGSGSSNGFEGAFPYFWAIFSIFGGRGAGQQNPYFSSCFPISREQKRHIRKSHIKFLKTPWMAGRPWDTRPVSRQNWPFPGNLQNGLV